MPTKSLEELQREVDAALRGGAIPDADRPLLQQVRADLELALAKSDQAEVPHTLRERLQAAIDRFENEHSDLTILLVKALDTLSELGV